MTVQTRGLQVKMVSTKWAPEAAIVRRGMLQICGRIAEYSVLQPAPTQWVVMALVSCSPGSPRLLVVTDGRSEHEALIRLKQQLHQFGTSCASTAFATDWTMNWADAMSWSDD